VSTHDDDILDFDFFDEGATREDQPSRETRGDERRVPRQGGGPRRPQFRPGGGLTPLLRLVGLIAFAILIVVLLVVWAQGCSSDHQRGAYRSYMGDIDSVGKDSQQLGGRLAEILTTPGLKQADLLSQLDGLIQQQQQDVNQAQKLSPPGPINAEHEQAVQALALRVNGMQGLADAFRQTAAKTDSVQAGNILATQARRLLASDIIWSDSFQEPAEVVLQDEGIEGLDVPSSEFITTDDLVSQSSLAAIWQRIQGASTGGTPTGLHGSGIAYVKALPSGQALSVTTETTIKVTDDLKFEVGIEDTGESQEVRIKVTLTIPKQPDPIVKTATIPIIDAGETKAVVFSVGALVPFGEQTSVKVDVDPVPGETNTANNTAEFPVIFTL